MLATICLVMTTKLPVFQKWNSADNVAPGIWWDVNHPWIVAISDVHFLLKGDVFVSFSHVKLHRQLRECHNSRFQDSSLSDSSRIAVALTSQTCTLYPFCSEKSSEARIPYFIPACSGVSDKIRRLIWQIYLLVLRGYLLQTGWHSIPILPGVVCLPDHLNQLRIPGCYCLCW